MVYIVMAYIVMAYLVMAFLVVAYLVMRLCSYGLHSYGLYGCGLQRLDASCAAARARSKLYMGQEASIKGRHWRALWLWEAGTGLAKMHGQLYGDAEMPMI